MHRSNVISLTQHVLCSAHHSSSSTTKQCFDFTKRNLCSSCPQRAVEWRIPTLLTLVMDVQHTEIKKLITDHDHDHFFLLHGAVLGFARLPTPLLLDRSKFSDAFSHINWYTLLHVF